MSVTIIILNRGEGIRESTIIYVGRNINNQATMGLTEATIDTNQRRFCWPGNSTFLRWLRNRDFLKLPLTFRIS